MSVSLRPAGKLFGKKNKFRGRAAAPAHVATPLIMKNLGVPIFRFDTTTEQSDCDNDCDQSE